MIATEKRVFETSNGPARETELMKRHKEALARAAEAGDYNLTKEIGKYYLDLAIGVYDLDRIRRRLKEEKEVPQSDAQRETRKGKARATAQPGDNDEGNNRSLR